MPTLIGMKEVEVTALQFGDFVGVVYAPDVHGNYEIITGEWERYVYDDPDIGTNNLIIHMLYTRHELRNIVSTDRVTETDYNDNCLIVVDEEAQYTIKFYLMMKQGDAM